MSKLYHSNIYFPKELVNQLPQNGSHLLTYSFHSKQIHVSRGGRVTQLPQMIDLTVATPIEIEVIEGKPYKVLYRLPFNGSEDICLAILLSRWFVKTFWFNDRNDNHLTLNPKKYQKGQ